MNPPRSTFHCHSLWSDGTATVSDMVCAAAAAGFTSVGISDHLVLHPQLPHVEWSMPTELAAVLAYCREVREAARTAPLPVFLGLEIDFFPDNPRKPELMALLEEADVDYLIGSVHYLGTFPIDGSPEDWRPLSQKQITGYHRQYWRTLHQLAEEFPQCDVVAHLDLPKKFGFLPDQDLAADMAMALDALAAAGSRVELNTAGWDKPCAEQYPSAALLTECHRRQIPVVLNDDAHMPDDVGRHYDRALELLAALGIAPVEPAVTRGR